jgi:hypothetical protein
MQKPIKFDTLSLSPLRIRDVTTGIEYEMIVEGFPEGYVGYRAYLNGKFLVRCNARSIAPAGSPVWRYEILLRLYRHGFIPFFSNSERVWEHDRIRFRHTEIQKFRDHVSFLSDFEDACSELARLRHSGPEGLDVEIVFVRNGEIQKRNEGRPFEFAVPFCRSLTEDVAVDLDTGLTFSSMTRDHGPGGAHLCLTLDGVFICGSEAKFVWLEPANGTARRHVQLPRENLAKSFEIHRSKATRDLDGWKEIGSFDNFLPTLVRGWQEFFIFQSRGFRSLPTLHCTVALDL